MRLLVFNTGSSSLKFQRIDTSAAGSASRLRGSAIGFDGCATMRWQGDEASGGRGVETISASRPEEAAEAVLARFGTGVDATAHRIVHGGPEFHATTHVDSAVLDALEAVANLAPLHNPPALAVMRTCRDRLGTHPMYAAFDTAYFHDLPASARDYALPRDWTRRYGLRRYGFHGIAHRHMAERALAHIAGDGPRRLITLQLGQGCSAAAILDGRPLETSMGFTPLEGLLMGTRAGDLDPGLVTWLLTDAGLDARTVTTGLNRGSGLLALSGASADMRTLLELEARGDDRAAGAVEAFCHRARKYLGAYAAVLGGVDAIVFGGGIGEHQPALRARICDGLHWCGVTIDAERNTAASAIDTERDTTADAAGVRRRTTASASAAETRISADDSIAEVRIVPVDEESAIASDVIALAETATPSPQHPASGDDPHLPDGASQR